MQVHNNTGTVYLIIMYTGIFRILEKHYRYTIILVHYTWYTFTLGLYIQVQVKTGTVRPPTNRQSVQVHVHSNNGAVLRRQYRWHTLTLGVQHICLDVQLSTFTFDTDSTYGHEATYNHISINPKENMGRDIKPRLFNLMGVIPGVKFNSGEMLKCSTAVEDAFLPHIKSARNAEQLSH